MRLLAIVVVALWACGAAAEEPAAALWDALRAGGHVALIRHAATTGGAGDPPGFRLDDCTTQRNLTDRGRAEARRLGERLRAEGIAVGKVLSSQWCRCRETADLMELGPHEVAPTFYARGSDGLPRRWLDRMKAAIGALGPTYNTQRMVQQYTERF